MADPRLLSTGPIALADIDRSARMRPVSPTAVEALVASIREIGMKDEIHVRKKKRSGQLVLNGDTEVSVVLNDIGPGLRAGDTVRLVLFNTTGGIEGGDLQVRWRPSSGWAVGGSCPRVLYIAACHSTDRLFASS